MPVTRRWSTPSTADEGFRREIVPGLALPWYTYQGPDGDTSKPIGNVNLDIYGYNDGETAPGDAIQTRTSDASGFFNFFISQDFYKQNFLLRAQPPANNSLSGAWSETGQVQTRADVVASGQSASASESFPLQ